MITWGDLIIIFIAGVFTGIFFMKQKVSIEKAVDDAFEKRDW